MARVEREPDVLGATGLLDGSPELLDPFETPRHRVVAWRWGARKVSKAIAWARRNWRTVKRWLDAGLSFATIMELILRALGLA
ncbi:aureocin A53 family class IId bacteriocin [Isoptericola rhizosphaerae]|uniref:aureocin A53 family class IId bacteriocin n=1 Tax=Isoptericola rhizosphaerae TaxID=3377837 RepID=UPI00383B5288